MMDGHVFDVGYKIEETAVMVWVSLRLFLRGEGGEDVMDVSL